MKNSKAGNQIIIYEDRVEVRFEDETIWLTQLQLSELFSTTKQNISLHIKNIFEEEELTMEATVKEFLTVQNHQPKGCL